MASSAPAVAARARGHATFHRLAVAAVEQVTDDAIAITFEVPAGLAADYDFEAGQHVNIRMPGDPDDVRRSYSICTPQGSGVLRIGVKQIPGGTFSSYAATSLRPGDELDVMTPAGRFTIKLDPARPRHYAFLVAGSGITPVLSLVTTVLQAEPDSFVTLLYGNRTARSVMFVEELADLKDRHTPRFQLINVLSREAGDVELLSGRIDRGRLGRFLDTQVPVDVVDEWFLCGPFRMVADARQLLQERGVARRQLHAEVYHADDIGDAVGDAVPPSAGKAGGAAGSAGDVAQVTASLDGRRTSFSLARAGRPVLDGLLEHRADAPFACRGGVCGTCRAKLVSGEVRMDTNWALAADEVEAGYVLTCQSHPVSDAVVLDYDA